MRQKVEFSRIGARGEESELSGSSHPSFWCPLGSLAIPHELSPLVDLLSFLLAVVLDWPSSLDSRLGRSFVTRDHPVNPTGIPVLHMTHHVPAVP